MNSITEITWVGRGGQGAVVAAELVTAACVIEGLNAMSIPQFGVERRGTPVRAYNRVAQSGVILPRTPILTPKYVVVIDSRLLRVKGLVPKPLEGGSLIINTRMRPEEVASRLPREWRGVKLYTLDAWGISSEITGKGIVNTVMAGALASVSQLFSLSSLEKAIETKFSDRIAEMNLQLARAGYKAVEEVKPYEL